MNLPALPIRDHVWCNSRALWDELKKEKEKYPLNNPLKKKKTKNNLIRAHVYVWDGLIVMRFFRPSQQPPP